MQNREEVFDWAATEWPTPQSTNTPAIYKPQPIIQPPARVQVVHDINGIPYYQPEPQPQPLPVHDPLPQRMYGCGVMAFGVGVGGSLLEAASWIMFKGMSMAEHAIIGISIAVALGAAAIVALKFVGGIRVSNVHVGDHSNFSIGGRR